jgi:hypothetical protein
MPRGDGTGPAGLGSMTGRAAGFCAGYGVPGFMNPYGGRVAGGGLMAYPARLAPGFHAAGPYGWGGYPAYGRFRPWGRGFGYGLGFGFGRGRARGRGRGWGW